MAEKIQDGECYVCDGRIVWKEDKRGRAYYACAHCQTRIFLGENVSEQLKAQANKGKDHVEKIQGNGRKIEATAGRNTAGNDTTAGDNAGGKDSAGKSGKSSNAGGIFGF